MFKIGGSLAALMLCCTLAQAIEIRIDYTYDTSNFFDTQEKRDAIEAVAAFYGGLLTDNLLRIDNSEFTSASWNATFTHPATGLQESVANLVVPEDVIIIYVGARELGGSVAGRAGPGGFGASGFQSWFDRLRGRGQAGAEASDSSLRTDFALWGGSIAFDTPRTWNFSLTGNETGTEFITVALHEMGHVLGIGTAATWTNQLSGGTFTGAAAAQSYGSAPTADTGHFTGALNSELFGSFSASHGTSRPVLMLSSFTDTGSNFDVATDLDLATLVDIGWQVEPQIELRYTALSSLAASFNWNSVSFKTYQIRSSTSLTSFSAGSSVGDGDGTVQSWSDPSPPSERGFYKLDVNDVSFPAPVVASELAGPVVDDFYRTITVPPKTVEDCCIHEDDQAGQ